MRSYSVIPPVILAFSLIPLGASLAGAAGRDAVSATELCHAAGNPAVRTTHASTTDLIQIGIAHSPTFAAEVRQLEASDVVAFVEPDGVASAEMNGYLKFLSVTPGCRYVRIFYDGRLNELRSIAIIGHELRHAIEVATHPEVVDAASLEAFYRRFGHRGFWEKTYDSEEAVTAGVRVMDELVGRVSATSSAEEPAR